MEFSNYIEAELFILVPVLYILGLMIKKSSINDKWIPIILGGMGIILATVYKLSANFPLGFPDFFSVIFAGVTQGILCASGSVYADNIIKQMRKDSCQKLCDESDITDNSEDNNAIR